MHSRKKQHVFIIGSKGIPAKYGGFETFVDKLTQYQKSDMIQYYVACAVDDLNHDEEEFEFNDAFCFNIKWKKVGPARAIVYDVDAIKWCIRYIRKNQIEHPIVYVLACRMGPFFYHYAAQIRKLGGMVIVNPDGHEWLRAKWSAPIKKYWKYSERKMVKHADLLICDSKSIEKYIQDEYRKYNPKTTYIAYGAETERSILSDTDPKLLAFHKDKGITKKNYYLVVGRFVPENNYETMIREYMRSSTTKDFVIITNVGEKFLRDLKARTKYDSDPRIKFVGTVYDVELLKKLRENAFGYLHGHEVGGTNPSLLEALGSTDLNLLLDVNFNREVAEDTALYWNKEPGNLAGLINNADKAVPEKVANIGKKAKQRIKEKYSWQYICNRYVEEFLKEKGE